MKKKIILSLIVLVVLFLMASPSGNYNIVEQGNKENDILPEQVKMAIAADPVGAVCERWTDVISIGDTTEATDFDHEMNSTRTLVYWQVNPTLENDDSEDQMFSMVWTDADTITFTRGDNDLEVALVIWTIEFSVESGVEVWNPTPQDADGIYEFGGTVDMTESWVIFGGVASLTTYTATTSYPFVWLSSTTEYTQESIDVTEWYGACSVQVISIPDAIVQRGEEVKVEDVTQVDVTISEVDLDRVSIFTQVLPNLAGQYLMWSVHAVKAHMADSTSLLFDKYTYSGSDLDIRWVVVEYPFWVETQTIHDAATSSDLTEDSNISAVTTTSSVVFLQGGAVGGSFQGVESTQGNDNWAPAAWSTEFVDSDTVRATRTVLGGETGEFYFHVIEFLTTTPSNAVPVNDVAAECTNLDDTDNLYARFKLYEFSVSVTDADGFADINYVDLICMNGAVEVWAVRFNETTNTFSEIKGNTYINLTGSTNVSSGVNLDITFKLYIEWVHPDGENYDLFQEVGDESNSNDTDTYSAIDYDYETRLDYSVAPSLSDGSGPVDRGNYNTEDSITAAGTLIYYGSADNYPPTGDVDVWVACSNISGGPWSDLTLSSGAFSMTVDSDDIVDTWSDIYTFKPVIESAGSGGATLYYTTDVTDTYIADSIMINTTITTDTYIPKDTGTTTVNVTAYLGYDDTPLNGTHTLYMNDTLMTWDTDHFYISVGPFSDYVVLLYFVNSTGATADYGITAVDLDGKNVTVYTEAVLVIGYDVSDARDDINDYISVNVTLQYASDNTDVVDGTIVINGYTFTYNGTGGIWSNTNVSATAFGITYDTVVCSGQTRDVGYANQNGQSQLVVWDAILITDFYGASRNYQSPVTIFAESAYDGTEISSPNANSYFLVNTTYQIRYVGGFWRYFIQIYIHLGWNAGNYSFVLTGAVQNEDNGYYGQWGLETIIYDVGVEDTYYQILDYINVTSFSQDANYTGNGNTVRFSAYAEWAYDGATFYGSVIPQNELYIYDNTTTTTTEFSYSGDLCYFDVSKNIDGNYSFNIRYYDVSAYGFGVIQYVYVANRNLWTIWDTVNITLTISDSWTVVGYNITLSATGLWNYTGWIWNGTLTTNATSGNTYPVETVVGNYSYIAAFITNTDQTNVTTIYNEGAVYCIWDDMDAASYSGIWVTTSEGLVFYHLTTGSFSWEFNSSAVADTPQVEIQSMFNTTATTFQEDDWGLISGAAIGDLIIGAFNEGWIYVNITLYAQFGSYNWSIYSIISYVNIAHTISIVDYDIRIEGDQIVVVWATAPTQSNSTGSLWENNTGVYSSIANFSTEGLYRRDWNSSIGVHNLVFTMNITHDGTDWANQVATGGNAAGWETRTYTYLSNSTDAWSEFYLYGPNGIGLDSELFKLYVNGYQISSRDPSYFGGIGDTINFTVLNFLDEQVYTNASIFIPALRFINIELDVYTLSIWNQAPEFIYFNITSPAGATYSVHMGQEIYRVVIYASTTYTYTFTVLNGPSQGTATGTINIDSDYGIIIDGWDSLELYQGLRRIGGGGSVSINDLSIALSAVQGEVLGQVQWYSWLTVVMLFVGLYAIPFVKRKGKVRGPSDTPIDYDYDYEAAKTTYQKKKKDLSYLKDNQYETGKKKSTNPRSQEVGMKTTEEIGDEVWAKLKKGRLLNEEEEEE